MILAMGLIYRFEDVLAADENDLFFRMRMAETARLAFLLGSTSRYEREGGGKCTLWFDYRLENTDGFRRRVSHHKI